MQKSFIYGIMAPYGFNCLPTKHKGESYNGSGRLRRHPHRVFCRDDLRRRKEQKERDVRSGLCAGRAQRRTVAVGVRLRNVLFFGSDIHRLRRPVRLAVRRCRDMDRHRERRAGLVARVGRARSQNAHHGAAIGLRDDARLFRQTFRRRQTAHSRVRHHLHIPYTLHGVAV